MPTSKLQEHTGSDKAWVWSAVDYADGEHRVELFCIRFGSPESERRAAGRRSNSSSSSCSLHGVHVQLKLQPAGSQSARALQR